MHFLGAAVSAVLAVRGVVALSVANTTATDSAIADDTTAYTGSDDLVATSTASYGIKPKVVIISHVSKTSCVRRLTR